MTDTRSNRRQNRIVDAPRQTRIVLNVTALPMSILLLAAIVMWLLTGRLFDEAEASNADLPTLGTLVLTQFLFLVLAGTTAIWEALRYSHRVVGPTHRLAASIRRLRTGDTGFRVELRKGDEMRPIAKELNALIESLEQRAEAAPGGTGAAAATTEPLAVVTDDAD